MITLLYCPQMEGLARRIAEQPGVQLGEIRWGVFKDGFPNMKIERMERIRNCDVAFLASFDTPGDIFRQLAAIYEIPRYAVKSFKVVLPYYPTGTMERVEEAGEIATAATLARMLSSIPLTISGPTQIVIYDIHALQELFYFSDQVLPRLETAVPLLKNALNSMDNIGIAFPDDGAWKRFGKLFQEYPQVICQKIRRGERRTISVRDGESFGKHVVIVDDLVMTGGTLLETRQALLETGATRVSCYATHGVFPGQSWKKFQNSGFERFWVTNSCPGIAGQIQGKEPFEVLSLEQPIARIIREP